MVALAIQALCLRLWPGTVSTLCVRIAGALAAFRLPLAEVRSVAICVTVVASCDLCSGAVWLAVEKHGLPRHAVGA